jgi:uncharacterized repeat protein (TIGR01451 family)
MKTNVKVRTHFTVKISTALLALGVIVADSAWAQSPPTQKQAGDLAISLKARKVLKQADGQERLLTADRAFPGEVIQYDALYLNKSMKPLQNVSPTLPIPNGMVFVPETASPAPAEASLDGRRFEPIPLKRIITLPDGTQKEREVPPTEYRALRWHLGEMPVGAQAMVTARTKLMPVGQ